HTPAHPCAPLTHTLAYLTGPQPPTPPLFPYTTLFRSNEPTGAHLQPILVALEDAEILPDAAEAVDIEVPELCPVDELDAELEGADRKSTRLNSSHVSISYAVSCLKKKIKSSNPSCDCS